MERVKDGWGINEGVSQKEKKYLPNTRVTPSSSALLVIDSKTTRHVFLSSSLLSNPDQHLVVVRSKLDQQNFLMKFLRGISIRRPFLVHPPTQQPSFHSHPLSPSDFMCRLLTHAVSTNTCY